jgi:hypothetical protein
MSLGRGIRDRLGNDLTPLSCGDRTCDGHRVRAGQGRPDLFTDDRSEHAPARHELAPTLDERRR